MRSARHSLPAAIAAFLLLAGVVPAAAQPAGGSTAAMDGEWHFIIAPYMWFSGIQGDLSVANLPPVEVDAPFSDIVKDLDLALDVHFDARKDRFGLGADVVWSNLGIPVAEDAEIADFNVDVRQLITEGFVYYRAASGGPAENPAHLDVLMGVRYTGTRSRLQAQGAGIEYDSNWVELSWVDLLAGLRFRAPLGSRMAILARADIAGLGSQVTWNLEGDLAFRASAHWVLGAGWRYLDIDYEEGEGIDRRAFQLAYSGPRLWVAYAW